MSEPFTIITTLSPDFAWLEREFIPTWCANSGADSIVVRYLDEGSWDRNIIHRAGIIRDELLARVSGGERVLILDADCVVLRNLNEGFSHDHAVSVARWPTPNMGVAFFNLAVRFDWEPWLTAIAEQIEQLPQRTEPLQKGFDQDVWQPRLRDIEHTVYRLPEAIWNFNHTDLRQWQHELTSLRDVTKVLHFKGHGEWDKYQFAERLAFARSLWPEELACIESD